MTGSEVKQLQKSNIDSLIHRVGDPDAWKTVEDIYNGREVVLDNRTIEKVKKIVSNQSSSDLLTKSSVIKSYLCFFF